MHFPSYRTATKQTILPDLLFKSVFNYVEFLESRPNVPTAWNILKRERINQPGQATAEEFMGTEVAQGCKTGH